MPIDNYDSQISSLIEILNISITLPIKDFLQSKTIKQHLAICEE